MNRGTSLRLLLLVLCFMLLAPGAAFADRDYLPPVPAGMTEWADEPLYERYPVWHYVNGSGLHNSETVNRLSFTMNLMQVGKAWFLKLAIRTTEYGLHLDLASPLVEHVRAAMGALVAFLWNANGGVLVVTALAVCGMAALGFWLVPGRRSAAVRLLMGSGALLLGSYMLFVTAPRVVVQSASVARSMAYQVVDAAGAVSLSGSDGRPADRLLHAAGERAWLAFVHRPWIAGEFSEGAAGKAQYRDGQINGGGWLTLAPTDRAEQYMTMTQALRNADFDQWDGAAALNHLPRRLIMSLVSLVLTLLFAGSLIAISGGILFFEILFVGLVALAPVWLMVALWRPDGLRMAWAVVLRLVGTLVCQVVLAAVLAVLLVLVVPIAALSDSLGWVMESMLLTLVAVVLCRYRFRWLAVAAQPLVVRPVQERRTLLERVFSRERGRAPATVVRQLRPDTYREVRTVSLPQVVASAEPHVVQTSQESQIPPLVRELSSELRNLRLRLAQAGAEGHGVPEEGERVSSSKGQSEAKVAPTKMADPLTLRRSRR